MVGYLARVIHTHLRPQLEPCCGRAGGL